MVLGAVEIMVTNYLVFAVVLGIAVMVLTILFVALLFFNDSIDTLERSICKRLDKQDIRAH